MIIIATLMYRMERANNWRMASRAERELPDELLHAHAHTDKQESQENGRKERKGESVRDRMRQKTTEE